MLQSFNLTDPPARLADYFDEYFRNIGGMVRLRAVLVDGRDSTWRLMSCAVMPVPREEGRGLTDTVLRYPGIVLHESWLDCSGLAELVKGIQSGHLVFGDITVKRQPQAQAMWNMNQLALENDYMARAGLAISSPFDSGAIAESDRPLLAVNLPYYPDLGEAVRAWIQLRRHNGSGDTRNRNVVFLMPELRAYFTDAFQEGEQLRLRIEGTLRDSFLYVKGAFWKGGDIHHVEGSVENGAVCLRVPEEVQRLEYVLTDSEGEIYDFQRESGSTHTGLPRQRSLPTKQMLAKKVRAACVAGEGEQLEFKPFVEVGQPCGNNKFREVVRTAVSFANTRGGDILIGVDDACQVHDVAPELARWGRCPSSEAIERYRGALLNAIVGQIEGVVDLRVDPAEVDGALVFVITVSAGNGNWVNIRGDTRLYIRSGASDRQVPPGQWTKSIAGFGLLGTQGQ